MTRRNDNEPAAAGTMRKFPFLLFATLLVLDVSSDLTQRAASGDIDADGLAYFLRLATDPWFMVSLIIPIFQLLVWTRILARVELSLASPLTSLNFPLTVWTSHLLFKESVDWRVWCGTLLITAGVMILGVTEHSSIQTRSNAEDESVEKRTLAFDDESFVEQEAQG